MLILNDDYTPMEFVVYVLERFFNKSREDATRIMLAGPPDTASGVCGVFTYEVAETKVAQVDRHRPPPSASSAVHHGKGLEARPCHHSRANLEETLHRAVALRQPARKHEYATLEHLLLSLIDDEDASSVLMRACDVDLGSR